MIAFPNIDPVAFHIGPLAVRWYALAYMAGVLAGWRYLLYLGRLTPPQGPAPKVYDDYISWAVLGIILGGRLGYVLFYNFDYFLLHPAEALMLWHGGMSFHGGAAGVILATWVFCRRNKIHFLTFADRMVCVVPIGLFFGRIANFINGELYGRVADVPWAMVFPRGGDLPRHPSQLYHAALEGLALLLILSVLAHRPDIREKRGFLGGTFLLFYGLFRGFVEFFREPDVQIGFLWGGVTMGQLLCIPMIAAGAWLIAQSYKKLSPP
jgi:phosphatidylglycerol:prolipoprotein diacylglycerol transferase